ncbi:MAG TPA: hypothetical protein VJP89_18090 [Pyrinomonadaceae bacterium]|nr:hypothetical protein [Pyrinomonadaceae bacterium]
MPEKKSTSTANVSEIGPNGSELGRATYSAQQVPGAVIIFAMGCHPTSGYIDFFEQSPMRIFPPQFIFRTIPPTGIVLPVLTPFSIWVMFEASEPVETVTVHDADGAHEIKVEQVPDFAKSGPWVSGSVVRGGQQGSAQFAARAMMDRATTMATGEEGGGGPTTMATGEETVTGPTTMATGEEGGGGPTTMATGEEETRVATTLALGEEGTGPTTMALGEEGPVMTTFALGEEGPTPTTFALGEEGQMTTFALGEETGGIPALQRNNPFGGF